MTEKQKEWFDANFYSHEIQDNPPEGQTVGTPTTWVCGMILQMGISVKFPKGSMSRQQGADLARTICELLVMEIHKL